MNTDTTTLEYLHQTLLTADNTFAQSRTITNLTNLTRAQRHYYTALSRTIRHTYPPHRARYLRAQALVKRARQNRVIATTLWNDNKLDGNLLHSWDDFTRNQLQRAQQTMMRVRVDIELEGHSPTPPKRTYRKGTAHERRPKTYIHPITGRRVPYTQDMEDSGAD